MRQEVKSIFILYTPGFAGNFLLRLFSLSDAVVPAMPKQMMIDWVVTAKKPVIVKSRLYSFDVVRREFSNNWLAFHAAWSDIYDKVWYESLTDLVPSFGYIIYQIHPFEFRQVEKEIAELSNSQFFYVDLDLGKYGHWVQQASDTIGFTQRGDEYIDGKLLRDKYAMETISLDKILSSTDDFLGEYSRVCSLIGLEPMHTEATVLRDDWLRHRGP